MFLRYNWFFIGWILLVAFLHAVPGNELPKDYWDIMPFDTFVHMVMFSILAFSGCNGLYKQSWNYFMRWHAWKIILVFSLTYAILLEVFQYYIFVTRQFELADILSDFIGVGIGFTVFFAVYGKMTKLLT